MVILSDLYCKRTDVFSRLILADIPTLLNIISCQACGCAIPVKLSILP